MSAITNLAGQVVERYSYNAYGVRTVKNPANVVIAKSVVGNDRGFTSYKLDGESSLAYARGRMFSPRLGRFISIDKKGYINGLNQYSAYFIPNFLDPTGSSSVNYDISFVADGGTEWSDWFEVGRTLLDTVVGPPSYLTEPCASNLPCDYGKNKTVTVTVTTFKYKVSYQRDQSKINNVYKQTLTITSTSNSASTINTALSHPGVGAMLTAAAAIVTTPVGVGITAAVALSSAISSDLSDSTINVYPNTPILLTQQKTLNGIHDYKYENEFTESTLYQNGPCY